MLDTIYLTLFSLCMWCHFWLCTLLISGNVTYASYIVYYCYCPFLPVTGTLFSLCIWCHFWLCTLLISGNVTYPSYIDYYCYYPFSSCYWISYVCCMWMLLLSLYIYFPCLYLCLLVIYIGIVLHYVLFLGHSSYFLVFINILACVFFTILLYTLWIFVP